MTFPFETSVISSDTERAQRAPNQHIVDMYHLYTGHSGAIGKKFNVVACPTVAGGTWSAELEVWGDASTWLEVGMTVSVFPAGQYKELNVVPNPLGNAALFDHETGFTKFWLAPGYIPTDIFTFGGSVAGTTFASNSTRKYNPESQTVSVWSDVPIGLMSPVVMSYLSFAYLTWGHIQTPPTSGVSTDPNTTQLRFDATLDVWTNKNKCPVGRLWGSGFSPIAAQSLSGVSDPREPRIGGVAFGAAGGTQGSLGTNDFLTVDFVTDVWMTQVQPSQISTIAGLTSASSFGEGRSEIGSTIWHVVGGLSAGSTTGGLHLSVSQNDSVWTTRTSHPNPNVWGCEACNIATGSEPILALVGQGPQVTTPYLWGTSGWVAQTADTTVRYYSASGSDPRQMFATSSLYSTRGLFSGGAIPGGAGQSTNLREFYGDSGVWVNNTPWLTGFAQAGSAGICSFVWMAGQHVAKRVDISTRVDCENVGTICRSAETDSEGLLITDDWQLRVINDDNYFWDERNQTGALYARTWRCTVDDLVYHLPTTDLHSTTVLPVESLAGMDIRVLTGRASGRTYAIASVSPATAVGSTLSVCGDLLDDGVCVGDWYEVRLTRSAWLTLLSGYVGTNDRTRLFGGKVVEKILLPTFAGLDLRVLGTLFDFEQTPSWKIGQDVLNVGSLPPGIEFVHTNREPVYDEDLWGSRSIAFPYVVPSQSNVQTVKVTSGRFSRWIEVAYAHVPSWMRGFSIPLASNVVYDPGRTTNVANIAKAIADGRVRERKFVDGGPFIIDSPKLLQIESDNSFRYWYGRINWLERNAESAYLDRLPYAGFAEVTLNDEWPVSIDLLLEAPLNAGSVSGEAKILGQPQAQFDGSVAYVLRPCLNWLLVGSGFDQNKRSITNFAQSPWWDPDSPVEPSLHAIAGVTWQNYMGLWNNNVLGLRYHLRNVAGTTLSRVGNARGLDVTWQYGTSESVWKTLPRLIDGTSGFSHDGDVLFDTPADLQPFKVRISADQQYVTAPNCWMRCVPNSFAGATIDVQQIQPICGVYDQWGVPFGVVLNLERMDTRTDHNAQIILQPSDPKRGHVEVTTWPHNVPALWAIRRVFASQGFTPDKFNSVFAPTQFGTNMMDDWGTVSRTKKRMSSIGIDPVSGLLYVGCGDEIWNVPQDRPTHFAGYCSTDPNLVQDVYRTIWDSTQCEMKIFARARNCGGFAPTGPNMDPYQRCNASSVARVRQGSVLSLVGLTGGGLANLESSHYIPEPIVATGEACWRDGTTIDGVPPATIIGHSGNRNGGENLTLPFAQTVTVREKLAAEIYWSTLSTWQCASLTADAPVNFPSWIIEPPTNVTAPPHYEGTWPCTLPSGWYAGSARSAAAVENVRTGFKWTLGQDGVVFWDGEAVDGQGTWITVVATTAGGIGYGLAYANDRTGGVTKWCDMGAGYGYRWNALCGCLVPTNASPGLTVSTNRQYVLGSVIWDDVSTHTSGGYLTGYDPVLDEHYSLFQFETGSAHATASVRTHESTTLPLEVCWCDSGAVVGSLLDRQTMEYHLFALGQGVTPEDPEDPEELLMGHYVTWVDTREGEEGFEGPFLQRLLEDGSVDPVWPENGLRVRSEIAGCTSASVCGDGVGGVYVAFVDTSNYPLVQLARYAADGTACWANTLPVHRHLDVVYPPADNVTAMMDGYGGCIVTWRACTGTNAEVYAQRVRPDGTFMWGSTRTILTNVSTSPTT